MQVPQSIPTLVRYSVPLCKIASEERVMLLKMRWKTRKEMNTQQTFHEPTYASSSPRVKEDLLTDVVSGNWALLSSLPPLFPPAGLHTIRGSVGLRPQARQCQLCL